MKDIRDEINRAVGQEVVRLREAKGMSMRALSSDAEIAWQTLALIEAGEVTAQNRTIQKLLKALGVEELSI